MFRLSQIAKAVGGILVGQDREARGVSVDTRTLSPGQVFFALVGRRDGTRFAPEALAKGAAGVVVPPYYRGPGPKVVVEDTQEALSRLAFWWRGRVRARVVAITGSAGKTTTKEMAYLVLSSKLKGKRAKKSFNNQIGVPLSILEITPEDQFAVLELGINRVGEMGHLASLARPHVAVITLVGRAHLEGLGSLEGVAREKAKLLSALVPGGTAVINLDSPMAEFLLSRVPKGCRIIRISLRDPSADLNPEKVSLPGNLLGDAMRVDGLLALGVGLALGVSPDEGARALEGFSGVPMRQQRGKIRVPGGWIRVINDAYNANPESLRALLSIVPRGAVFVLGDMLELGPVARELHREAVREVLALSPRLLLGVGPLAGEVVREVGGRAFPGPEEAGRFLRGELREGDTLVLKASRSVGLEKLLDVLKEE